MTNTVNFAVEFIQIEQQVTQQLCHLELKTIFRTPILLVAGGGWTSSLRNRSALAIEYDFHTPI